MLGRTFFILVAKTLEMILASTLTSEMGLQFSKRERSFPLGLFALGRKIRFGVYKKIENFVNANFWFLWARSHLRLANFL